MSPTQKWGAVLGLLFGAVTYGLVWYPYRLLEQAGVSGVPATFVTYALPGLIGIVLFGRSLAEFRRAPLAVFWLALTAGWTNLAYVLAVLHGEIMRVLLLFYLAPLWTIVFARALLGEKLNAHGYVVMLLSFTGAVVMLWRPEGGLPWPRHAAEWFAVSAGLMFALSNVLARRAEELSIRAKSLAIWLGVTVVAGAALAVAPGTPDWSGLTQHAGVLLGVVALSVLAATVTVQYGLALVPANQAIVILLFELVVAAVSSYFLAAEALTAREWVGGAMIVAASLFSGKLGRSEEPAVS